MQRALRFLGDDSSAGDSTSTGNVICGSTAGPAISFEGTTGGRAEGNRIGVDESGAACTGGRANHSGILVQQLPADVASGNMVGGSGDGNNTISNSVNDAIVIASTGGNLAKDNVGSGNGGQFVDIGGFTDGTPLTRRRSRQPGRRERQPAAGP